MNKKSRTTRTASQKLVEAEQKAAYWLHLANLARERGDYEIEQRHLEREQKWHDVMNHLLGND